MKENFWKRILHDRQKRRIMLLCLIALIAVTTFAAFTIHKTSDRNGQATPGQDQVADAAHLTEEDAGSDLETDTGADTETDQDYEDQAVSSDTKEKDAVQKKSLLGRLKDTLKGMIMHPPAQQAILPDRITRKQIQTESIVSSFIQTEEAS